MANGARRAGPGTWALMALAGGLLLMLLGWAVAWRGDGASYGWGVMPWGGMMAGWMGAMMPLMLLGMLLFWAAAILGLVALVRWAATLPWGGDARAAAPREEDALEIARRRYARGEIGREEYQRLRDDLAA